MLWIYFGTKAGDQDKNWAPHICYQNMQSSTQIYHLQWWPVSHSEDAPVPHPPKHVTVDDAIWSTYRSWKWWQNDPNFEERFTSCEPYLLTQGELYDLVWDLKLSKKQAELLGSRLKGGNLLQKDTKVCLFRNRQEQFQDFCSEEKGSVHCNNICAMMDELGNEYKTTVWRLFIDSSKTTLRIVLLHSGNKFLLCAYSLCN